MWLIEKRVWRLVRELDLVERRISLDWQEKYSWIRDFDYTEENSTWLIDKRIIVHWENLIWHRIEFNLIDKRIIVESESLIPLRGEFCMINKRIIVYWETLILLRGEIHLIDKRITVTWENLIRWRIEFRLIDQITALQSKRIWSVLIWWSKRICDTLLGEF